jgi:hypothetical protein
MRHPFRALVFVLVFSVSVAFQTDRLSAATYRVVGTLEIDTVRLCLLVDSGGRAHATCGLLGFVDVNAGGFVRTNGG